MIYKIYIPDDVSPSLAYSYSKFIFRSIKKIIRSKMNKKKYDIRESSVLSSSLIRWRKSKPSKINLQYYMNNCLELSRINGEYIIRLNDSKRVRGSYTKVSTLVRMIEYGTEKIPPYPLIRYIFYLYNNIDQDSLFTEFMKERFTRL